MGWKVFPVVFVKGAQESGGLLLVHAIDCVEEFVNGEDEWLRKEIGGIDAVQRPACLAFSFASVPGRGSRW